MGAIVPDLQRVFEDIADRAELQDAVARARVVKAFSARAIDLTPRQQRLHDRDAAALCAPGRPWLQLARSPEVAAIFALRVGDRSPSWRITGRPPVLWTRLVCEALIATV